MSPLRRMRSTSPQSILLPIGLLACGLVTAAPALAQADSPIPAGDIRIHYFRPDSNYAGWTVYAYGDTTEPNDFAAGPVAVSGTDSFGAYFDVGVTATATNVGLILHNGNNKDLGSNGPTEFVDPATKGNEYWELSGSDAMLTMRPSIGQDSPIPTNHARIHYYRPDGNYANWVLYVYGATTDPNGDFCATNDTYSGYDSFGPYFDVAVTPGHLGFIIHNCTTNTKDPGPDQSLEIPSQLEGWVVSGDPEVFPHQPTPTELATGPFNQLQAYWIDATTIAVRPQYLNSTWTYTLNASLNAGLKITSTGLTGGTILPLTPFSGTLTPTELTRFPELSTYALFKLPANVDPAAVRQALKSQLEVSAVGPDGTLKYTTGVQTFGALDALLAYNGPLGVIFNHGATPFWVGQNETSGAASVQVKVWAPTAQSLSLLLFANQTDTTPEKTVAMTETNGVWTAAGDNSWKGQYYQIQARVFVAADQAIDTNTTTDPYSVDLSLNGVMTRITDLDSQGTKPVGWDASHSPALASLNDMSIYELHVRDFSVGDPTVPNPLKGTYEAFTNGNGNGMRHLHTLALSGLKAVHLLPTFHFGSVNEDKSTWLTTGDLTQYSPDGTQQQQAVENIQGKDAYNWGYDPVHYMAPEGAYAVDPSERVKEYRDMVMGLHQSGLRVIQDVVFNHTYTSGEDPTANLDELVPNYYHRLDANGVVETGSCCYDTASEHVMMEKLMTDTVLLNVKEYKIDGFRFDAMGLHFVYNMTDIRNALNNLTLAKDGVDGSKIYMYGEGFQIAEATNNAIGPNASQQNLAGTGIGSFNDRMRDAVRGGYAFGNAEQVQGFATGLATDPSAFTNANTSAGNQLTTLLQDADLVRASLAGALSGYTFEDAQGQTLPAGEMTASGEAAGYSALPTEDVNYCSVHDNQTLFDAIQIKSAAADTVAARARRQVVAISLLTLAQGIPFYREADDLLGSKDMDNGSYNSGDWFNKVDWSGQGDNWGTGLPVQNVNGVMWPVMQPLLADPKLKPTPADIAATAAAFQDFLRIRYSTGLFRMASLAEIQANLSFLNTGQNQTPGLIVMKLDDHGQNYGGPHQAVVFFNASNAEVTFTNQALAGMDLRLDPIQQNSSDPIVKQSTFDKGKGSATVPALSTAVFVSN